MPDKATSTHADVNLLLEWNQDLQFRATGSSGNSILLDGDSKSSISPMESLLAAFCACMASDVVMILQKMRADFNGIKITASAQRNPEPPKFFRKIELTFSVIGNIARDRVEHAIALSFERYCSVFHSLRKDIEVTHNIEILD